ncbi:MAG TPA: hypothetical protein VGO96_16420 [Pyrinomonadaceae bacterium]|jgi:hypothetical protein|nr:hypothetical protein [Pyrinomonadaceae bacterium]
MKSIRSWRLMLFVLACAAFAPAGQAQQQQVSSASAPNASTASVDVERIIREFTAKEVTFREALNQYSFKREAIVQTIGMGGQISGEYRRVSRFVFDDSGKRYEKILLFPLPTLTEVQLTVEDLEDLSGVQTFALEPSKINLYNLSYVGKEKVDELMCYVFDVEPKVLPDPKKTKERFFKGRIWIDDQDVQVVKVRGKGVPEKKNSRYPTYETYREQVDGKFWFPTYTYADEELIFDSGQVIHLRMRITFDEFVRPRAKVKIIDEGQDIIPTPSPTPEQKKP